LNSLEQVLLPDGFGPRQIRDRPRDLEDPVTGSSHSTLIPFWSAKLGKKQLLARQLSARGGTLHCEDRGERVSFAGTAKLYLSGTIRVPV
jgi:predicted PhzF superfamily epimerase YddE/YHI9